MFAGFVVCGCFSWFSFCFLSTSWEVGFEECF